MTSWELLGNRWFWVLVHSLWQQSLVAIGLWAILRTMAARSAERRYAVTLGVFAFAALLPAVTWAWLSLANGEPQATPAESMAAASTRGQQSRGASDPASPPVGASLPMDFPQMQSADASSASANPGSSRIWLALLLCWSAGAMFHLVRAVRDLSATAALLRGTSLHDVELWNRVERVRELLRLRRRFEVMVSPGDVGPFVFGLWKPTLVLPAALLIGLPPDQLEAVLFHELAHLKRYDDVVNLLQRLGCAVFFFNPAFLWMSRVLCREREAACDARAVACVGSPFSLAEALVRVAEIIGGHNRPAMAALNFAESENDGALLDRVSRIVRPNERPRLRLGWPALLGALLFVGLFCLGFEQAAFWSISLAKDWLSPEQRIAAVAEALGDFRPGPVNRPAAAERFRLKGTIKGPDGALLPEGPGHLCALSRQIGSSTNSIQDLNGNHFDVRLDPGECWLAYFASGYAPAIVGPFRGAEGGVKEDLEIVLKTGSSGAIRVVDAKGRPIPDAQVTALPDWGLGSVSGPSQAEKTDSDGIWKSDHLADSPYRLTIRVPGYNTFNSLKSVRITSQPVEITLDPSDPISAIVVDGQGNPVSGAQVGLLAEKRPGATRSYAGSGNPVAVTGEDGTFSLDEVSSEWTYDLLIDAGAKGHALAGPLRVDGKQVRIELQKKLTLAGQIRGNPGELATLRKQYFGCLSPLEGNRSSRHSSSPIDDEGRFQFDSLFAGKYQLSIGKYVIKGELADSKTDLVIDLQELQQSERSVEIRFVEGGLPVRPGGSIGVQTEILDEAGQLVFGGARTIVEGVLRLRLRTPNSLNLKPDGCLGYWFEDVSLPVPDGDEPFAAEIPVLPAGAVRVKVLSPARRGNQVGAGIQFSVPTAMGVSNLSFSRNAIVGDEIVLSPVPLDVPCLVSASQEYRRAFSPEFRLEGDAPVRALTLALPSAIDATVRIEAPDGAVLSRIVCEVHHSPELPERDGSRRLFPGDMTWSSDQLVTDRDGRVTLVGMPADASGYTITARSMRDWQPGQATIRTDGSMTVLTLRPGKILDGKVVDAKTGKGVPEITLRATPAGAPRYGSMECQAEGPTDAEGNFRFSNLPDEPVKLWPFPGQYREPVAVMPGAKETVIVEIQVR